MQLHDYDFFTEKLLSYIIKKLASQGEIREKGSFGIQPKYICSLAGRSYHQNNYNPFVDTVLKLTNNTVFKIRQGRYLYFTDCVHKVGGDSKTGKQFVLAYKTATTPKKEDKIIKIEDIDFDIFKVSSTKAVNIYKFLLSNKDCEEIVISYDEFKEQTDIDLTPKDNFKRILVETMKQIRSELNMVLELEAEKSLKMLKITYNIFTHYPGVNSEKELSDVVDFAIATSK